MDRVVWLYEFYGQLLTEKQREMIELYYHDDLSLAEIAANAGTSRQAVYDVLKRAVKALEDYENKLGLWAKFQRQREVLLRARDMLAAYAGGRDEEKLAELAAVLEAAIQASEA